MFIYSPIVANEIKKFVGDFMWVYHADAYGREHSYDYVHKKFDDYVNNRINDDCMALHLFAFLASWGMLRGSTLLLYKSYKFLIPLCKVLKNTKYSPLYDYNPFTAKISTVQYINLMEDLVKDIATVIGTVTLYKGKKQYNKSATETLVIKVILGTYGCIPAYDDIGKARMKQLQIPVDFSSKKGFFSRLDICLKELLDFANTYKKELNVLSVLTGYSIMKVLDMYFWMK